MPGADFCHVRIQVVLPYWGIFKEKWEMEVLCEDDCFLMYQKLSAMRVVTIDVGQDVRADSASGCQVSSRALMT